MSSTASRRGRRAASKSPARGGGGGGGAALSQGELRAVFDELDTDSSGDISLAELQARAAQGRLSPAAGRARRALWQSLACL